MRATRAGTLRGAAVVVVAGRGPCVVGRGPVSSSRSGVHSSSRPVCCFCVLLFVVVGNVGHGYGGGRWSASVGA